MQLDSRVFAAQWNTEGKPTIGMEQFCQNVHKLGGTECTEEEVEALFTKQLDANGGKKEVDMETLKAMMKGCLDAKEAAVQSEKRTAKLVAQKEAAAREVQGETKRKLEDDERRLDEKRLEAEAATLREAEAAREAEEAERVKKEKEKSFKKEKEKSFNKKIEMKRAASGALETAWMANAKEKGEPPAAAPQRDRRVRLQSGESSRVEEASQSKEVAPIS